MTTSNDSSDSKFKTTLKRISRLLPSLTPKQRHYLKSKKGKKHIDWRQLVKQTKSHIKCHTLNL